MQARPEDLRSFAENLDINQFKALSPGLGLGDLRPKRRSVVEPKPIPQPRSFTPEAATSMTKAFTQQTRKSEESVVNAAKPGPKRLARLGRRLKASGLDALLVCLAIGIALATGALAQGLKSGVTSEGWVDLGIFKWIRQFALWELGAMVGALFMGYVGLFRGILGHTPGENITGCVKNRKDILGYKVNRTKAPL